MLSVEAKERLSELVSELRAGRSLRDYAKVLGVSASTVRAWEKGEAEPLLYQMEILADQRGWSFPYFYYYIKGKSPSLNDVGSLLSLLNHSEQVRLLTDIFSANIASKLNNASKGQA